MAAAKSLPLKAFLVLGFCSWFPLQPGRSNHPKACSRPRAKLITISKTCGGGLGSQRSALPWQRPAPNQHTSAKLSSLFTPASLPCLHFWASSMSARQGRDRPAWALAWCGPAGLPPPALGKQRRDGAAQPASVPVPYSGRCHILLSNYSLSGLRRHLIVWVL